VSPWGEILAEAGVDPDIILADIDCDASSGARARIPSLQHDKEFDGC
jgi:predicted amidohydrolase